MISNRFSPTRPVSSATGRHGELIVVQGGGVRPIRIDGVSGVVDAGMPAPDSSLVPSYVSGSSGAGGQIIYDTVPGYSPPPQSGYASGSLKVDMTPRYYVARVDVRKAGACYYAPPAVSFSPSPFASGGGVRSAKAAAYLSQSSVSEVRVIDGGKNYRQPPAITLSDSHGKGAVLTAVLDSPPVTDPANNPYTGISQWEVVEQPSANLSSMPTAPRFAASGLVQIELPISGNGTFTVNAGSFIRTRLGAGNLVCGFGTSPLPPDYVSTLTYRVSGWTSGTGAILRMLWSGGQWITTCAAGLGGWSAYLGATTLEEAAVKKYGADYGNDTIRIEIDSVYGEAATIAIEGYTASNPNNTAARRYSVKSVKIDAPGEGYVVAPQLKFVSPSGFGAYATCGVTDGKITSIALESGGGGYKVPPVIEVQSGAAEAFAVARPHLRGKYQCYYRYIDDTPKDRGGPIPSSLSPVAEVDCGEGAASLGWSGIPLPYPRARRVELWRTTGNQATTLYRVATVAGEGFTDDLTDDELRDANRPGYEAMPIVLPNGELNANRFTPPPSDKAVVVRFQDRHWYAVDTGGKQPNTVLFSEVDEPESVPDVNELVVQQNSRDADAITALIPFGATLLIMQSRHAYSLTFAKQPLVDGQVSPLAFRGAVNQRCWDIHDGTCYVMDQYGIYALSLSGSVDPLSEPIADAFREKIDFAKSTWNFLVVDPTRKVIRAAVAYREDESAGYPTRMLCYSLDTKAWWVEKYPHRITGGTQIRLSNGDYKCVYAGQGGPYLLNEGGVDAARGAIRSVTVTDGGAGYKKPPIVRASGGSGAILEASVNDRGSVTAIWIKDCGHGYASGDLYISPPDEDGTQATATFSATPKNTDTPAYPAYRYKSGTAEYVTDSSDTQRGGSGSARNVSLTYRPQPADCNVSMRLYYNNSPSPRATVAPRNRGIGFAADVVDGGHKLDMSDATRKYGSDSGVANALLAGRTFDDVSSADRHVAVELVGARKNAEPVVFYQMQVQGTAK